LGSPAEGRRTLAGLKDAAGRIQSILARNLTTRQCPHLRFHLDESLKKSAETIRLINESMAEIQSEEPSRPADGSVAADQQTAQESRDEDQG
jgi:hypothetical protein